MVAGAILLAGWVSWASVAHVTRYEVSSSARIEVHGAAYPIQAEVPGQVVSSNLTLGREVHTGDVLFELDSRTERLNLTEAETRFRAFAPQIAALQGQINNEGRGQTNERLAFQIAVEEAKSRYEEAEAQAALSETQADRSKRLWANGLIPLADEQRALAESKGRHAAADNLRIAIQRLSPEQGAKESDRDAKVSEIAAELEKLEADRAATEAEITRLHYEIDRRTVRAAADGRLSDCAALRSGTYIKEGDKVGTILPGERLQVVADFPPQVAFGKVREGQSARLKLNAFPWMQFGTVSARVSRVAGEVRDGRVRVELTLVSPSNPRIPLQHGLPGTLEVETERITPLALLVRSAGRLTGEQ
jgi:membrane fusion protein (multidrug efflux system)